MAQYIFTKKVTITGTHADGHVPVPTHTFLNGQIINGTLSPASTYPVSKNATVRFTIGDESYETELSNLRAFTTPPLDQFMVPDNNPSDMADPNTKKMNGWIKFGIGIAIVLVIIGILKLFKVF